MAEAPWLTIIGIGDNGRDSLGIEAQRALDAAQTIVASRRVLDAMVLDGSELIDWSEGVEATIGKIRARRGSPVTVLATGDPMHFGIGATLSNHVAPEEMRVLPHPSAFSLAAARLGWALQDTDCVSLHGRRAERIAAHLGTGRKILALTAGAATIGEVAAILLRAGYGGSAMTVLEHMGGAAERILRFTAATVGDRTFAEFNTLAVICRRDGAALLDGGAPGLADDAFRHDGQITKREIRAVVMAHLRPGGRQRLWDIGAGCGSVGIEWLRAAPNGSAVAIEPDGARLGMIADNARLLGAPQLKIVAGTAPEALSGLSRPDAVFIGGGLTGGGVFEAAWQALQPQGRLVATAVTLQSEARLSALHEAHGGELTRIAVSRAAPVGRFLGWRPLMPVTVWAVEKGG